MGSPVTAGVSVVADELTPVLDEDAMRFRRAVG
jgi:hypothetical protein